MTTDFTDVYPIVGGRRGYREGQGKDAMFDGVKGFLQLNTTHIIVVDSSNHCIRLVSRLSNQTQPFVGTCGEAGYRDGTHPLFNYPWSITRQHGSDNYAYITDARNNAIREINIGRRAVRTVVRSDILRDPLSLTYNSARSSLIITHSHGLARYHIDTYELEVVVGSGDYNYHDGSLDEATFNCPHEVTLLSHDLFAVADYSNHLLRIVSLKEGRVSSLCNGQYIRNEEKSDKSECTLKSPSALLLIDEFLYIGENNAIHKIRGSTPYNTL